MNKLIALWMGERDGDKPWNLNYDSPDHFARLTKRLFENTLLYERFEYYAGTAWANSGTHQYMIQWLFQSDDQLRYTRFITLFTEFLRLPEVVERFGWEECPNPQCEFDQRMPTGCGICNGTGKIQAEWAKLAKEGR
jgi:hypothetical protein